MIGDQHRRRLLIAHHFQRVDHAAFGIPRLVGWPWLTLGKAGFDAAQLVALVAGEGDDQARMIAGRGIEFHAIENQHFRHGGPRLVHFRPGLFVIQLAMVGPAVIGADHPAQAELARHLGVATDRIAAILAQQRDRRRLRAGRVGLVMGAELTVDMMVAGQPQPALGGHGAGSGLVLVPFGQPTMGAVGIGRGNAKSGPCRQSDQAHGTAPVARPAAAQGCGRHDVNQ